MIRCAMSYFLPCVVVVSSGAINSAGAPSCGYLELMPELFPGMKKASLRSHMALKRKRVHTARNQPQTLCFANGNVETPDEIGLKGFSHQS